MNRLSPLIVRRTGAHAIALPLPPADRFDLLEGGSELIDDLRLFAIGWAGGLVFFWTLFS
jgi:hypothetical protein